MHHNCHRHSFILCLRQSTFDIPYLPVSPFHHLITLLHLHIPITDRRRPLTRRPRLRSGRHRSCSRTLTLSFALTLSFSLRPILPLAPTTSKRPQHAIDLFILPHPKVTPRGSPAQLDIFDIAVGRADDRNGRVECREVFVLL